MVIGVIVFSFTKVSDNRANALHTNLKKLNSCLNFADKIETGASNIKSNNNLRQNTNF